MKIATWNVNSLRVRLSQLSDWLTNAPANSSIDVIALQEIKMRDEEFPRAAIEALGLHAAFSGQRTYNGVAILSRLPIDERQADIPDFDDEQKRVLAVTVGGVRIINVYVPNGQTPESDKFFYKLRWLAALRTYLQSELKRYPKLIVLGDYNIAPEDRDVHDPKAWEGSVHVTPQERAALKSIADLGLVDVFRQFEQPEKSFSWWDYRAMAFRRNHGLRIDLILASGELAAACESCQIDRQPRTWERPSDHTPIVATFVT
ncbi:MAG: exodeoxyribonuclease III [Candidatus Obscuribacterales bacterium]|nr:exodeoxyribonuclease III [Steroidobacteraceae bacterium]